MSIDVDGLPVPPKRALPFRPRGRIHVRFWKRQRPRRLFIRAYQSLDAEGLITGRSRRLRYDLGKRVWTGGGHIWIATVRAPKLDRLYLSIFVRWRDEEDCGGAQSMNVLWHLRK